MTAGKSIKEVLFSDRGMKIVNVLFWLTFLSHVPGVEMIAGLAWAAYLAYGIKISSSKFVKIMLSAFMVLAMLSIALGIYGILYTLSN